MKRVVKINLFNCNKSFKFFISYCIAVTLFVFNATAQTVNISISDTSGNNHIKVNYIDEVGDDTEKIVKVYCKIEPETEFFLGKTETVASNSSFFLDYINKDGENILVDIVNNRYAFYFEIYEKIGDNDIGDLLVTTHVVSPIHFNLNVIPEADPTFSNPPELTFNKYWFEEVDDLEKNISIYRKIGDAQDYVKIKDINITSIGDLTFEDNTMNGVCDKPISYYIISNTGKSKSIEKEKNNYTENNKPENPKMLRLSVDDGMLIVNWEPSVSPDIAYYTISKQEDGAFTWEEIIKDIPNNYVSYVIDSFYCNNFSNFDYSKFKVFCVDSCGNESYKLSEDYMSPIKLVSVDYDHCNKLTLKWYDSYCLEETKGYILNILDYANDTIFSEKVDAVSLSSELFTYDLYITDPNFIGKLKCSISAYNDKDKQSHSCYSEVEVDDISALPSFFEIVGIEYISEVSNKINFILDSTYNGTYSLYRKSSDYIHLGDLEPNESTFLDSVENNKPFTYILKAKNSCDVYYPDSSYLQSIYLTGAFDNEDNNIQLCFSNMHSYSEEENFEDYRIIVDGDTNQELNYFTSECNENFINDSSNSNLIMHYCYDDIAETDFVKSFQIKYINVLNNDEVDRFDRSIYYSYSNIISIPLLDVDSISMPNAIVLNADNPINSKFGPMSINQLLALGVVSYNFQIFNSWGEMVWQSTDVNTKPYWEGKSDLDESLLEGTYLYNITIEFPNNKIFNKKGTVTLFKK